jgi:hypothetical protein
MVFNVSKNILQLTIKIGILISILFLTLLLLFIKIYEIQRQYEQRSYLLNRVNTEGYKFALIGDSVFCSYYVNDDKDTIWNKFESITGNKCYPGALNASKNGDLINAARYISSLMPANSTIFMDIMPTRFIGKDKSETNIYEHQFRCLLESQKYSNSYNYLKYMDLDYVKYIQKILHNIKTDRVPGEHYDRRWNADGDFALNRYKKFIDADINMLSKENMRFIYTINDIFIKNKMKAVFVLTALNKKQIYTYSGKDEADQIYSKLNRLHEMTKIYLNSVHFSYIDLFEAVPDYCFADLVHTNACGDKIIASSMADYALNMRK